MSSLKFNYDEEREAYKASNALLVIVSVVLILSTIGFVALAAYSLMPTCPILQPECDPFFDKGLFNLWLLPVALGQFLVVLLVAAFGRAFAASIKLQAIISLENT
jgi:hypothetical protein